MVALQKRGAVKFPEQNNAAVLNVLDQDQGSTKLLLLLNKQAICRAFSQACINTENEFGAGTAIIAIITCSLLRMKAARYPIGMFGTFLLTTSLCLQASLQSDEDTSSTTLPVYQCRRAQCIAHRNGVG